METSTLLPRSDLLDHIRDALTRGSVLLHGPRRVGKSTAIEQLAAIAGSGLMVVRVDLEGQLTRPVDSLSEQVRRRLADLGASAELNDVETIAVPPMPVELAATLFETELASDGRLCSSSAALEAARLAGGSPHWVKRLASLVGKDGAVDEPSVQAAVERLLAPALRRELSDEGREHFQRRYPEVWPAMAAILEAVAGGDHQQSWEAAISAALAVRQGTTRRQAEAAVYLLMDGFYLRRREEGSLDWVNPLLRRWWLRYGGP